MKRELVDTIIKMIEENVPKEVIMRVTEIDEHLFNQIKLRYTI